MESNLLHRSLPKEWSSFKISRFWQPLVVRKSLWGWVLCLSVGCSFFLAASAQENPLKQIPIQNTHDQSPSLNETRDRLEVLQLKQKLEDLEGQMRALRVKLEQLSQKVSGARGEEPKRPYLDQTETFETSTVKEIPATSFGEEREAVVARDPLPDKYPLETGSPSPMSPSSAPPVSVVPLTETSKDVRAEPAVGAGDPRQDFDAAYAALVQKNYASAQTGFRNFIKSYPTHSLVPNAVFWLGETHYGLGNYADAAEAFDLVLQGYGNSPKAPESLIKKGMALAALGKKAEACAALGKLPAQYPTSSMNIKAQALDEKSRIGCP